MPIRQLADAGAQSTVASAITAAQTSATVASASGFPAILAGGGELSVVILDPGNPAWNKDPPLSTPYEYQQVNPIRPDILTFRPGCGGPPRSPLAVPTPKAFCARATIP